MEGWTSQKELNWELEFAILVTEDTSSKVHQKESVNRMVVGTRESQLAKVCLPVLESTCTTHTYSCPLEALTIPLLYCYHFSAERN